MKPQLLSFTFLVTTMAAGGCHAETPVPFHEVDRPLVQRALNAYSGNGKIPAEQVARRVYPVVVHLPGQTCVGLNLKRGMAGGDISVCFDNKTGGMKSYYVNGQ